MPEAAIPYKKRVHETHVLIFFESTTLDICACRAFASCTWILIQS